MRQIPGDPLTGSLPRTQLILKEETVLGPGRRMRIDPNEWPKTPEPQAVTYSKLRTGAIASVRTRHGVRNVMVRVVHRSRAWGSHRGTHYFVGMNRNGLCRSYWVDQVIGVQSTQKALAAAKIISTIVSSER